MDQMGSYDLDFQGLFGLIVLIAQGQGCPDGRNAWFDSNDLLHKADCLWDVLGDIGCVAFSEEGFDLLGEHGLIPWGALAIEMK